MRIQSRGCNVVGRVEIAGAAGGGSDGSETALGGLKEAETGIDESERSLDAVKSVLDVDGAISRWYNGSPTRSPGRGKLAVLRRLMLSTFDGDVMLLGTSSPPRSAQSRSDSAALKFCRTGKTSTLAQNCCELMVRFGISASIWQ